MAVKHLTPLKKLLSDRGVTLMQLAVIAGTSESTVSKWRNRITPPAEQFRERIIEGLELTDEEIMELGWPEAEGAAGVRG